MRTRLRYAGADAHTDAAVQRITVRGCLCAVSAVYTGDGVSGSAMFARALRRQRRDLRVRARLHAATDADSYADRRSWRLRG